MVRPLLVVALVLASGRLTTALAAETLFPYRVKVTSAEAIVRSGPGDSYYPTMKLRAGDVVEVYRHDPGGWCAIRPPDGSFSCVSSRHVRVRKRLATVDSDRAVALVGSSLSDKRDVIQVRLSRGEVLDVLDMYDDADVGDETLLRVAPPAGEFRWIANQALDRGVVLAHARTGDVQRDWAAAAKPKTADGGATSWTAKPTDGEPAAEIQLTAGVEAAPRDARFRSPAPLFRPAAPKADDGGATRERESDDSAAAREPPPARTARAERRDDSAEDRRRDDGDGAWSGRPPRRSTAPAEPATIDELEIELSRIMADDPSRWDFSDLIPRVEATLDKAETVAERADARRLLARIDRFDALRGRYAAAMTERRPSSREISAAMLRGEAPAGASAAADESSPAAAATASYDGRGTLRRVVSRQTKVPGYALFDDAGKLTHYVSPAPGVNLQAHVGQTIGVTGTRDRSPQLSAPLITARNIEPLRR